MLYIAIDKSIAKRDIPRALRFRIEAETITDMLIKLERLNHEFTDYYIFSVN